MLSILEAGRLSEFKVVVRQDPLLCPPMIVVFQVIKEPLGTTSTALKFVGDNVVFLCWMITINHSILFGLKILSQSGDGTALSG